MYCNLRPPDIAPVVLGFNYEVLNASSHKFNVSATVTRTHNVPLITNFNSVGECMAELLLIIGNFFRPVFRGVKFSEIGVARL